jgi:hypothetical protein
MDGTLDPIVYYAFSSSRLESIRNYVFIRSSSFESFSSLRSDSIKNLAVKYGYFSDFKVNVIQVKDDHNLIFKNSMIMYNACPGIVVNIKNPENKVCIITHCNFDWNTGKGILIHSRNKQPENELAMRI